MKEIDAIIFDVDGTIWDSVSVCTRAWNEVLEKDGTYPPCITDWQLKGLFGKPMDEIFRAVLPEITKDDLERISALCMEYENTLLETVPGKPYGNVKETMEQLSKYVPLFIVSNCQSGYIQVCMKTLQLEPYITDYTCFGDCPVSKGENIKRMIKKHHLKNPVYVGDTQGDADACEEAQIPIIFASYGFGTVKEPYRTIGKFEDLITFFLS